MEEDRVTAGRTAGDCQLIERLLEAGNLRSISVGGRREAVSGDEGSVYVVQDVGPDLADVYITY